MYATDQVQMGGDTRAEFLTLRGLDPEMFGLRIFCPPAGPSTENFSTIATASVRPSPFGADLPRSRRNKVRSVLGLGWSVAVMGATAVRRRPDVVFVGDRPRPIIAGLVAATVSRAKIVYHPQFFFLGDGFGGRMRRRIAGRASLVICHSQHSKASYVAIGVDPDRIVVASNPVDVSRFEPGDGLVERQQFGVPADGFVVGNTSVMRPFKGQDVLLHAVALARDAVPELHLVLGGDGPTRDDLEALTGSLELEGHVTFTGFLTDPAPVYRALDVFVMPSLEEPFGLVTIEAMACERPVIGTDSGGTPEIVDAGVTGVLVPPADSEALAAAIVRMHADPQLRSRMGRAGRERARDHFTAERRTAIVAEALSGLVATAP